MTTPTFYRTVARTGRQTDRGVVKRATAAVLHALRDRLTGEEADQLAAQLPIELKDIWGEGDRLDREPVKLDLEEFCERVRRDVGLSSTREARWMILAVLRRLHVLNYEMESSALLTLGGAFGRRAGCVTGVINVCSTDAVRESITPERPRLGEDHAMRVGIKAIELLIAEGS